MKCIVTADWHLRNDRPRCRLDEDWYETQVKMVKTIKGIARRKECERIFNVGDVFHTPQQPAKIILLLSKFKEELPCEIFPGNHDLPYHDISKLNQCALGVALEFIGVHKAMESSFQNGDDNILLLHTLTFPSEAERPSWDGGVGHTAQELLDENPNVKWIFVGDYHKAFHYENKGRHVINPGCTLRQTSCFIDYEPSVYFVDTDTEQVERIPLPDTDEMVTDEYVRRENERNDRIDAFVESIQHTGGVTLDFLSNLKKNMSQAPEEVQELLENMIQTEANSDIRN